MKWVLLLTLFFVPLSAGAGFTGYVEQWATSATASSTDYGGNYDPLKATGNPDGQCGVSGFGFGGGTTWTKGQFGAQWIKLSYSNEVYPLGITIYQTVDRNVTYIEGIDVNDNSYVFWNGSNTDCSFSLSLQPTAYKIKYVKVTIGADNFAEIDAVQLKGYTDYVIDFYDREATPKTTKGSSILLSVGIDDPRNITSAKAIVTPPLGAVINVPLSLSSGAKASGRWSGTWTSSATSYEGTYSVVFEACNDFVCKQSSSAAFEVISGYVINLTADRAAYKRGENVLITGDIKDSLGSPAVGDVSIEMVSGNFRANVSSKSDGLGNFRAERTIGKGDPAGAWTVKATAAGTSKEIKTKIDSALTIDVSVPNEVEKGQFYKISGSVKDFRGAYVSGSVDVYLDGSLKKSVSGANFSSELFMDRDNDVTLEIRARDQQGNEGSATKKIAVTRPTGGLDVVFEEPSAREFYWGDVVKLKVRVMDSGKPVKGASIMFRLNEKEITARETDGAYEASYDVGKLTGELLVRAEAKKDLSGASSLSLMVKEPQVKLETVESEKGLRVKATVNGKAEEGLAVYAMTAEGQRIELKEDGNGLYSSETVTGPVRVYASSEDGKKGYEEIVVKAAPVSKSAYLLAIAAFFAGAAAVKLLSGKEKRRRKKLQDIEEKMKVLQKGYLVEKSVNKETYEKRMLELEMEKEDVKKRSRERFK